MVPFHGLDNTILASQRFILNQPVVSDLALKGFPIMIRCCLMRHLQYSFVDLIEGRRTWKCAVYGGAKHRGH